MCFVALSFAAEHLEAMGLLGVADGSPEHPRPRLPGRGRWLRVRSRCLRGSRRGFCCLRLRTRSLWFGRSRSRRRSCRGRGRGRRGCVSCWLGQRHCPVRGRSSPPRAIAARLVRSRPGRAVVLREGAGCPQSRVGFRALGGMRGTVRSSQWRFGCRRGPEATPARSWSSQAASSARSSWFAIMAACAQSSSARLVSARTRASRPATSRAWSFVRAGRAAILGRAVWSQALASWNGPMPSQ